MQDINKLSYDIIGCAMKVYNKLGPGLLELVYEKAMIREMNAIGLKTESQKPIDIIYNGEPLGLDLRLDILVEDAIIIELKSVEELKPVHSKQLFTYLKLTDKRLGLLINFNVDNILKGIRRVAYNVK